MGGRELEWGDPQCGMVYKGQNETKRLSLFDRVTATVTHSYCTYILREIHSQKAIHSALDDDAAGREESSAENTMIIITVHHK